jgi:flagellar biosynthesis anti-sigma factor FlgM
MDFLTPVGHELAAALMPPREQKARHMTKLTAGNADDMTNLRSGNDAVEKLKMQLYTLPDIRQRRVDALKQAIRDGNYKISPLAVAAAMLSELDLE